MRTTNIKENEYINSILKRNEIEVRYRLAKSKERTMTKRKDIIRNELMDDIFKRDELWLYMFENSRVIFIRCERNEQNKIHLHFAYNGDEFRCGCCIDSISNTITYDPTELGSIISDKAESLLERVLMMYFESKKYISLFFEDYDRFIVERTYKQIIRSSIIC